jgi:hypothetical protein
MSLCEEYLSARGITSETARIYGLELDEQIVSRKVKERLGRKLPKGVNEVIWIPLSNRNGEVFSWIARPLPTIGDSPKFLCPVGSDGPPYIARSVYGLAHGLPIIITEGPVKALACIQAGVAAIGLNGVFGLGIKNNHELVVIRADIYQALEWTGRKVYLAFDADSSINPMVRRAMIRAYLLLSSIGVSSVYQLTSWDISEGKGIDDFLAGQNYA